MKQILFVNACPRPQSRTRELAQAVLEKMNGQVQEVCVFDEAFCGLDRESLQQREALGALGEFTHPMFRFARDFAAADEIIVAAPYWDLMFPAALRGYWEAVTVNGLTFTYGADGAPRGLCRADRLIYVTTAGGPIFKNFGFDYVQALAQSFYGIGNTVCIAAEGLDISGADAAAILRQAKRDISL